jgi:hypothetical protein
MELRLHGIEAEFLYQLAAGMVEAMGMEQRMREMLSNLQKSNFQGLLHQSKYCPFADLKNV